MNHEDAMNFDETTHTRLVAALCTAATLVSCARSDDKWVERQIPEDPATPAVTSTEVTKPTSELEGASDTEARPTQEIPEGMSQVTFDLPAVESRNVKTGMFIDVFAVVDTPGRPLNDEILTGQTAATHLQVARNACDDRTCSLTVFVEEAIVLAAIIASPEMTPYVWIEPEPSEDVHEVMETSLKQGLVNLERLAEAYRRWADEGRRAAVRRRLNVELTLSARAASTLEVGATGDLIVTFPLSSDMQKAKRSEQHTKIVTINMLQNVRLEGVRAEDERVVVEVDAPLEHAALLTLARHAASRVDFAVTRPDEPTTEVVKNTAEEALITVGLRSSPLPTIRSPKKKFKTTRSAP